MTKIQIFSIHHKTSKIFKDSIFQPIQVGAACAEKLLPNMIHDNTGKQISAKNQNYCELTGLYWIWKNLSHDIEYIGLAHYRRFLDLPSNRFSPFLLIALYRFLRAFSCTKTLRMLNWLELLQISLNEDEYFKKLERLSKKLQTYPINSDILIPHKEFLPLTVLQQYAEVHRTEDLLRLLFIVKDKFPAIYPYFKKSLDQMAIYPANLFLMRRDIFEEYMFFLFESLFLLEKMIQIPNDIYQKRIFGFLSERLMLPFIEYKKSLSPELLIKHGFIYLLK